MFGGRVIAGRGDRWEREIGRGRVVWRGINDARAFG